MADEGYKGPSLGSKVRAAIAERFFPTGIVEPDSYASEGLSLINRALEPFYGQLDGALQQYGLDVQRDDFGSGTPTERLIFIVPTRSDPFNDRDEPEIFSSRIFEVSEGVCSPNDENNAVTRVEMLPAFEAIKELCRSHDVAFRVSVSGWGDYRYGTHGHLSGASKPDTVSRGEGKFRVLKFFSLRILPLLPFSQSGYVFGCSIRRAQDEWPSAVFQGRYVEVRGPLPRRRTPPFFVGMKLLRREEDAARKPRFYEQRSDYRTGSEYRGGAHRRLKTLRFDAIGGKI